VLGGVCFRRSFEFCEFLSLSFACLFYFDFELFFVLSLVLPLFEPFVSFAIFPSSR
jgi:hypothetical protein